VHLQYVTGIVPNSFLQTFQDWGNEEAPNFMGIMEDLVPQEEYPFYCLSGKQKKAALGFGLPFAKRIAAL
jgi:hypothetical protein